MAMNTPTRRGMISAIAAAPVAAVMGCQRSAAATFSRSPTTAEAERIWAFINTTRARLHLMTEDEDPDLDHPLWDELGDAEGQLRQLVSPSPRVAEMHLWLALDHAEPTLRGADLVTADKAIALRDIAALATVSPGFDFPERMIVSALQCLRAAQEG